MGSSQPTLSIVPATIPWCFQMCQKAVLVKCQKSDKLSTCKPGSVKFWSPHVYQVKPYPPEIVKDCSKWSSCFKKHLGIFLQNILRYQYVLGFLSLWLGQAPTGSPSMVFWVGCVKWIQTNKNMKSLRHLWIQWLGLKSLGCQSPSLKRIQFRERRSKRDIASWLWWLYTEALKPGKTVSEYKPSFDQTIGGGFSQGINLGDILYMLGFPWGFIQHPFLLFAILA